MKSRLRLVAFHSILAIVVGACLAVLAYMGVWSAISFFTTVLARDRMSEGLSLQEFHRDESSPIGLVDLMYRANVRVV